MRYTMLPYGLTLLNGGLFALNVAMVAAWGNPINVGASAFIGVCLITQFIGLARLPR